MDELFEDLGENPRDHFNYLKKNVHCQYFWNDGYTLTAYADLKKYFEEIDQKFGIGKKTVENIYFAPKINMI